MDDLLGHIDDTIHAKVRLAIMAILASEGEATFARLKGELRLTDGNLAAHLRALEAAGYVRIRKEIAGRKPRTTVALTERGRGAFEGYLGALEQLLQTARRKPSQ